MNAKQYVHVKFPVLVFQAFMDFREYEKIDGADTM